MGGMEFRLFSDIISCIWENLGNLLEIRFNFLIKFSSHVMHLYCLLSDWSSQYCPKGSKLEAIKWIIHYDKSPSADSCSESDICIYFR